MRSDLPAAIQKRISQLAPDDGPQLLFDRRQLEANMLGVAAAARAASLRVLFAVKSFPHREVLELAARTLDGFDVSSVAELRAVRPLVRSHHARSLTDPTGRAAGQLAEELGAAEAAGAVEDPEAAGAVLISCEDRAQLERALRAPAHVQLALRLSSSLLDRDPAVGAVQSGDGHHRSRFGLDVGGGRGGAALAELVALAAACGRPLGVHLHHSGVVPTSTARVLASAHAALAVAAAAGLTPSFLNLGGSWHGLGDALAATWLALRAALPAGLPLWVEPGRLFARGAGFAVGWVQAARSLEDRQLRVCDLSRSCHLRWSQPALVAPAPRPGHAAKLLFVGPTCYEDDVLGEWLVDERHAFAPGSPVVLREVSGYAVAWNAAFAGVPAATVELV